MLCLMLVLRLLGGCGLPVLVGFGRPSVLVLGVAFICIEFDVLIVVLGLVLVICLR